MANITSTGEVTKPINAMFTRRFLEKARYETHYFAGTLPATISKHGGSSTALWRRVDNLTPTTSALSELTTDALPTRSSSQASVTDVTKAVAKYGDFVTISEEVDVFNFNGTTAQIMDSLAEQAGRSLNQVQRNEMEDNATARLASGVASAGAIINAVTAGDLNNVINTLDRNVARPFAAMTTGSENTGTAPILKAFWGITHPDVAADISGLTGFASVETYAGQVEVMPGEFGFYGRAGMGVRLMSTADSSIDLGAGAAVSSSGLRSTSATVDVYNTVIYGKNAVGSLGLGTALPTAIQEANSGMAAIEVINKGMGSSGVADPLNELSTLGWKAWSAAKILDGTWIRNIRSGATLL